VAADAQPTATMPAPPPLVLLFKGSEDDDFEEYSLAMTHALGAGAVCVRIPVLAFAKQASTALLCPTPASGFTAVVATSARAAWAVQDYPCLEQLCGLPWYVVGSATAQACRELGAHNLVGEASGSAQELFERFISPSLDPKDSRILFLCGELRRPTLPDLFATRGYSHQEAVVYRTILRQGESLDVDYARQPVAAVFFSPSGVQAVESWTLGELWTKARVVAIGPTTAQALKLVHAVADAPTPMGAAMACAKALGC
jgi:uroporphyrinogen-III synthase